MTGQMRTAIGLIGVGLLLIVTLLLSGCSSSKVTEPDQTFYTTTTTSGNISLDVVTVARPGATCPTTNIVFDLPTAGHTFLELTNATGYHVRTLIDEEMEPGSWTIEWDGKNDDGEDIDPGIFMFHLVHESYEAWHPFPIGIELDGPGEES